MAPQSRALEIVILDDLDSHILQKVIHFFNSQFPGISSKLMGEDFFRSKINNVGSLKTGYLTVAMFGDEVVGTCSAIRKEIFFDGRIIQAVEIGDTYTSMNFRRDCHFQKLYLGTGSVNDYLNKSIFGRLATETLDRAKSDGIEFVYGVPNHQAKLSWIGRLNFELIDRNSTYRVSSPSLTHPSIRRGIGRRASYGIYYRLTLYFSMLITHKYKLEPLPNFGAIENTRFHPANEENLENMQLMNSSDWVRRRFLCNSDKEYTVIQIKTRKDLEVCGYLFFLLQTKEDGFRLYLNSKELLIRRDLERFRMPFSRIAVHKFFSTENLSMWIDLKITRKFMRFFYGYPAKPIRVDIVGKGLTCEFTNLKSKVRFYNFQYGDSDLG